MTTTSIKPSALAALTTLGVSASALHTSAANALACRTPITGEVLATLAAATTAETETAIARANAAFNAWRNVPAPKRGELVRLLGNLLREHKATLGELVSIESGKIRAEGLGEVQEMIDICDFAVGLSRQLYGLTIATERPGHRMMETWHPAGVCGVITAFNFPVAVWAWNAALALVCGDSVIWKPSEKTPLTALATQALFEKAVALTKETGIAVPDDLNQVVIGRADVGQTIAASAGVAIVSATGSTRMGRAVGQVVAARFGKSLLELGGNNAMAVCASADLELATRAIVFSAVGTAGQRCTSLRRLFVHRSVYTTLVPRLKAAYATLPIGNPLTSGTLVGPLVDSLAFDNMQTALSRARSEGATVTGGERVATSDSDAYYVKPALVEANQHLPVMCDETFAPILYVVPFDTLDEAIAMNNSVSHGLSSSIFTNDIREAEQFMSAAGSDCGIANVNIGPSGAEIGGAFGGEKETGGGRESGSDSWRAYMRRATNTINYSRDLPLAQGIKFDV